MNQIADLTDVDIAEVDQSRRLFEQIDAELAPLRKLLDFWQALRWLPAKDPVRQRGWADLASGRFGDVIDVVNTEANVIACILDNSITAMTGHQENPGTAKNLRGEPSPVVDIESLVLATGIAKERVRVVDPLDLPAVHKAIEDGIAAKGPFVIITKRPCVLIKEVARKNACKHCRVNREACKSCRMCLKIGCPAIAFSDGKSGIDAVSCTGCGLCVQVCKFNAIERMGG